MMNFARPKNCYFPKIPEVGKNLGKNIINKSA